LSKRRSQIDVPAKHLERESFSPLTPLNDRQAAYIAAILMNPQVVGLGPAGTGKSFIASTIAADLFRARTFRQIILTRPNVPGGRSLGFFPGGLEEKFGPWAAQIIHDMKERMGAGLFELALKRDQIQMVPFEVMRGRSWDNAFILLDEAQNTTPSEMKMFLTRIGMHSKVVVDGDLEQSDIGEFNGLQKMLALIDLHDLPVPVVEFGVEDIVRSEECAMWIRAFR
jgi:phosphate starvation-inducible PhoH-like protein